MPIFKFLTLPDIYLPSGESARNMDPIVTLKIWAEKLKAEWQDQKNPFIETGMGKPTYPYSLRAAEAKVKDANLMLKKCLMARQFLPANTKEKRDQIVKINASGHYGNPQGDLEPRRRIASVLNQQYKLHSAHHLTEHDILFTCGGVGGLSIVSKFLNERIRNGKIITTRPHYPLYSSYGNNLFYVDVMKEKGYRLTANALAKAIQQAQASAEWDGREISAILFCDPHNPLGTVMGAQGWEEIAQVLRRTNKNIFIVIDGPYEGLQKSRHISLLEVAPDLMDRIILFRSATKELSAASDRMAVLVTRNRYAMSQLLKHNIDAIGHFPRHLQYAYAAGFEELLDEKECHNLSEFYGKQVEFVVKRSKEIGISLPDSHYKPEGAFYVMVNLSALLGMPIPAAAKKALGNQRAYCKTDQDIAYSLLFSEGIMITPMSFFKLPSTLGYLRITCSGGDSELADLMARIEKKLIPMRSIKLTAHSASEKNLQGHEKHHGDELKNEAAIQIQALFRGFHTRKLCNKSFAVAKVKAEKKLQAETAKIFSEHLAHSMVRSKL